MLKWYPGPMCYWRTGAERERKALNAGILLHRLTLSLHITLKPLVEVKRLTMGWMGECWREEIMIVFLFSHFIPLLATSPCSHALIPSHFLLSFIVQHSKRPLFLISLSLSMYLKLCAITTDIYVFVFLISESVSNDASYSWAQPSGSMAQ